MNAVQDPYEELIGCLDTVVSAAEDYDHAADALSDALSELDIATTTTKKFAKKLSI